MVSGVLLRQALALRSRGLASSLWERRSVRRIWLRLNRAST
jgi:hypothetical protein